MGQFFFPPSFNQWVGAKNCGWGESSPLSYFLTHGRCPSLTEGTDQHCRLKPAAQIKWGKSNMAIVQKSMDQLLYNLPAHEWIEIRTIHVWSVGFILCVDLHSSQEETLAAAEHGTFGCVYIQKLGYSCPLYLTTGLAMPGTCTAPPSWLSSVNNVLCERSAPLVKFHVVLTQPAQGTKLNRTCFCKF